MFALTYFFHLNFYLSICCCPCNIQFRTLKNEVDCIYDSSDTSMLTPECSLEMIQNLHSFLKLSLAQQNQNTIWWFPQLSLVVPRDVNSRTS